MTDRGINGRTEGIRLRVSQGSDKSFILEGGRDWIEWTKANKTRPYVHEMKAEKTAFSANQPIDCTAVLHRYDDRGKSGVWPPLYTYKCATNAFLREAPCG